MQRATAPRRWPTRGRISTRTNCLAADHDDLALFGDLGRSGDHVVEVESAQIVS
jgi:hypothetical protein